MQIAKNIVLKIYFSIHALFIGRILWHFVSPFAYILLDKRFMNVLA